jgi:hypothetical protein
MITFFTEIAAKIKKYLISISMVQYFVCILFCLKQIWQKSTNGNNKNGNKIV